MNLILHIAESSRWATSGPTGSYTAKMQREDGFIHCSDPSQLLEVANALYKGERGLVLLCIDPAKVKTEIRYEKSGPEAFPHIYGPLNTDAVVAALPFEPDDEGKFRLPSLPG